MKQSKLETETLNVPSTASKMRIHTKKTKIIIIIIILFLLFDSWNFNNFISNVFVIIFVVNSLIFVFLIFWLHIISDWRINVFFGNALSLPPYVILKFPLFAIKNYYFLFLLLLFFIWFETWNRVNGSPSLKLISYFCWANGRPMAFENMEWLIFSSFSTWSICDFAYLKICIVEILYLLCSSVVKRIVVLTI